MASGGGLPANGRDYDSRRVHRHPLDGTKVGSSITSIISMAIGLMLLILVVGCFLSAPAAGRRDAHIDSAASQPWMSIAMLFAAVPALRSVLLAYDGWYSPIYMAEENTNPERTLPRAIIGGTLLVTALYLVINVAFLHVLPLSVLAASELPAADAARIVLPRGGRRAQLVTVISLLTVLSLFNNVMLHGAAHIVRHRPRRPVH